MSLQWTLIAGFLYIEAAIVLLLVLPVFSPKRWNAIFKSRFLSVIGSQISLYFMILLGILVLFLLDAIREMRKYSHTSDDSEHRHLNLEMQENMRLFRAQRNFYISSFALFFALIIRRLVALISAQAGLLAQCEASMRQAQSATTAARSMLNEKQAGAGEKGGAGDAPAGDVDKVRASLKQALSDLEAERKDKLALKKQAESLNKEYDRLTEEYSKLQKKVQAAEGKKGE